MDFLIKLVLVIYRVRLTKRRISKLLRLVVPVLRGQDTFVPDYVTTFTADFARHHGFPFGYALINGSTAFEVCIAFIKKNRVEGRLSVLVSPLIFPPLLVQLLNLSDVDVTVAPLRNNTFAIDYDHAIFHGDYDVLYVNNFYGLDCLPSDHSLLKKFEHIVLDLSHSHGYHVGRVLGSCRNLHAVVSMQGSKTVSGGEAGMLLSTNPDTVNFARIVCDFGRGSVCKEGTLLACGTGTKRRVSPLAIAYAIGDLRRLSDLCKTREQIYSEIGLYLNRLYPMTASTSAVPLTGGFRGYPILVKNGGNRRISTSKAMFISKFPYIEYTEDTVSKVNQLRNGAELHRHCLTEDMYVIPFWLMPHRKLVPLMIDYLLGEEK
jgi:dTDP-4-amino-4,6-dideoxygalactose transaminase